MRTMKAHHTGWWAWMPLLIAATLTTGAAAGETIVKFSLDYGFEGPAALFLHPLDKGYYKSEGLNVTIHPAANSIEPIERVASGEYDIGFGDINTLIKHRDAKPGAPVKAAERAAASSCRKTWKERRSAHRRPTVLSRSGRFSCR
jgi:ABC-type nitrate/sulfonate/bicarbonate transport system substrate-binding protein